MLIMFMYCVCPVPIPMDCVTTVVSGLMRFCVMFVVLVLVIGMELKMRNCCFVYSMNDGQFALL